MSMSGNGGDVGYMPLKTEFPDEDDEDDPNDEDFIPPMDFIDPVSISGS